MSTRLIELFPQTKGWFAIVSDAKFRTRSDGALLPDLEVLSHSRVRQRDAAGHGVEVTFPSTFSGALRIANTSAADQRYVEVKALAARAARAVVDHGLVVYENAYADTDVLYKATPTHVDEYLWLRTEKAPRSWRYALTLGPAIVKVRQAGALIEAVDAAGRPWLRASRPVAFDSAGKRAYGAITVADGQLVVSIDLSGLKFPVLVDPDWKSTGDMAYGRFYHRFNELPDGTVLATGGCSAAVCSGDLRIGPCRTVVSAPEVLDVDTALFSVFPKGTKPRYYHVAESLPNGDVLIAGGCTTPTCSVTDSAEILSAASGTVTDADALPKKGAGQVSVVLQDGRVLVAGGCDLTACDEGAFAFDAATKRWQTLAPMKQARGRAGITLLPDGRVLVTGGCTDIECGGVLASAEIYDPKADTWTALPSMSVARAGHYQAVLPGGRVLVGGGCVDQGCTTVHKSTDIYDSAAESFKPGPSGQKPRFGAVALPLPNGNVLVSQGCYASNSCDLTNELYDHSSETFSTFESAVTARAFHAVVLHSQHLVIANGGCQPGTCSWWNEYFDLATLDGGLTPFDAGGVGVSDGGNHPAADGGKPKPPRDASVPSGAGSSARRDASAASSGDADGGGCGCAVPRRAAPSARTIGCMAWLLIAWSVRRRRARSRR